MALGVIRAQGFCFVVFNWDFFLKLGCSPFRSSYVGLLVICGVKIEVAGSVVDAHL